MHTKSKALAGEPRIAHVEHHPPGRQHAAEETIEPAPERENSCDASPSSSSTARPLGCRISPEPIGRGASNCSKSRDAMAVTGEEKRGGEPGRPRTGDGDRKRAHRASYPPSASLLALSIRQPPENCPVYAAETSLP